MMTTKTIAVKAVRYCWLFLTGVVCWIFLYLFNRTYIIGRENFPREKNTLVIPNHQSWMDSWVATFAAYWPWMFWMFWKFNLAPWHMADRKNFFGHPVLAIMSWLSQCISVDRSKSTFKDILKIAAAKLIKGTLVMFPEGGRHRGKTQKERDTLRPGWTNGAAWLACQTQSEVVPIGIRGMADVWPVGEWPRWPRWPKRKIVVVIGEPIDLAPYWEKIGPDGFDPEKHRGVMLEVSEAMKTALQDALDLASTEFYKA